MIRNTDGTERLYLSKGDQSIYIENCKIPQHHIDGIRFLYRQYKKKKSGVIINDTSGYGRNLQIVLFVKAMRHLFNKPVLVLCHEGTEHDWVEQFQTWTDLCDDVALEIQKPFIKKLVLINTMSNLDKFASREWSVLVMDGDSSTGSKQVLRLPFKADYKIWVTPVNLRENIDKFSEIFKWLYPKTTFDRKQFTPDVNDPLDVVDKAVLLDAFMEDIVAKSEQQDTNRELENDKKDDTLPMRISRKNKDATGTKIKRSKRKIYDDEDDVPLSKTKKDTKNTPTCSTPEAKSTTVSNEDYENAMSTNYESTEDFSVDNFKRKSIEEFDADLFGEEKEQCNTINSQIDLYYEPDQVSEDNSGKVYEMDTLVLGNTCDDQSANVNNVVEPQKHVEQNNESNISDFNDDTPSEIDFDVKNDSQFDVTRNSAIDTSKVESNKYLNDITEDNKNSISNIDDNMGSPTIFSMPTEEDNAQSPSMLEMESDINDIKSDIDELEASENIQTERNKIKSENKEISNTQDVDEDEQSTNPNDLTPDIDENVVSNEVHTKSNEDEIVNNGKSVTNTNHEVVSPVTSKQNTIEDKIKEMEEKALNKFKGSILDSLF